MSIPLSVPEISGREWEFVKECLDTGWVSSVGPFVERFEQDAADTVGTRFGVATVNGTSALHIALHMAGVRTGDEVLTSDLTFIASVNAIRYLGAWPVLMDAEPTYWQMDVAKVAEFLARECENREGILVNRSSGRRIKAIMPVDILGHPVDLDLFLELARKYDLAVVEDATESLGARYKDQGVGARADLSCLSFNGNKIITTGGGGMILTNREDYATRARYLTTQAKLDPIEFIHGEVGYNYRLTNVLAAIGCAQIERLSEFVIRKREIAALYRESLGVLPGIHPMAEAEWAFSTYWMYTVLVDPETFGMDSRTLLRFLADRGIQARPLWQPMHESPAHSDVQAYRCEVSTRLNRLAISLPCSAGLTPEQQDTVIRAVQEAYSKAAPKGK